MSKQKTYTVISKGNECPKCHKLMDRRTHKKLRARQLNAAYYFSHWDYCWDCKHLQHYEQFKVINNNKKSARYKEWQEYEEQQQHFFSI